MASQIARLVVIALAVAVAPLVAQDVSRAPAAGPAPVKIAVFAFELEDSSPAEALLGKPGTSAATLEKVSDAARDELARSGHYVVIDASKVGAKPVVPKALQDCDGCEAGLAEQLGAQQSLIGLVRKVTQTDYYVVIRIRDAKTGKLLAQEEANFAGDEQGWASGVRMLIRHQVLPGTN